MPGAKCNNGDTSAETGMDVIFTPQAFAFGPNSTLSARALGAFVAHGKEWLLATNVRCDGSRFLLRHIVGRCEGCSRLNLFMPFIRQWRPSL